MDGDVFWRPDVYAHVLTAYVRWAAKPGMGRILSLAGLSCRKTIFCAVDDSQHLLLRAPGQTAQLSCIGESLPLDPFALELVIDAFPEVADRQRTVACLADLYCGRAKREHPWTTRALHHRNNLIAFDGRELGLTHREIARLLYGEARVAADWSSPARDMKNRVARAVRRGRQLVAGGYLSLLR